jgi:hypothetical protein
MTILIIAIVIGYIIIGCIVGTIFNYYVPDDEETMAYIGTFWILSAPVIIIFITCTKLCKFIRKIITYFDKEGFHYYKGKLKSCCGKCKYMEYQNYHNEINKCKLDKAARLSSQAIPCEKFKKNLFWRFTIRINKHEIQCNN